MRMEETKFKESTAKCVKGASAGYQLTWDPQMLSHNQRKLNVPSGQVGLPQGAAPTSLAPSKALAPHLRTLSDGMVGRSQGGLLPA